MAIDWEVEYNNRARVPEHPQIFERWAREGAAYRDEAGKDGRAEIGLKYGPSPRQTIDLFKPRGNDAGSLALFIHGGYWRSLEPSSFSQMARGMNAHGVTVAVVGYDLCAAGLDRPDRRADPGGLPLSLEAARQAHHGQRPFRRRPPRRLHGGDRLEEARRQRAGRSGAGRLRDLRPVRPRAAAAPRHQRRLQARLPPRRAGSRRCSGRWRAAACSTPWSAARNPSEFLRQSKTVADGWRAKGAETRYEAISGMNHFTVCDPMTDPGSAMTKRLVELAKRA